MKKENKDFIERLIEVTDELDYRAHGRQTQLAKRYGLAQTSVRKWFTGDAMPGHDVVSDLCRRAGISYVWLINGTGAKFILPSMESDPQLREIAKLLDKMNEEDRALMLAFARKVAPKPRQDTEKWPYPDKWDPIEPDDAPTPQPKVPSKKPKK